MPGQRPSTSAAHCEQRSCANNLKGGCKTAPLARSNKERPARGASHVQATVLAPYGKSKSISSHSLLPVMIAISAIPAEIKPYPISKVAYNQPSIAKVVTPINTTPKPTSSITTAINTTTGLRSVFSVFFIALPSLLFKILPSATRNHINLAINHPNGAQII